MKPSLWFERRFDFSFGEDLLPNILVRLRGTPARLEELLRGAAQEALIAKADGQWSAQEHAGHLLDMEPLWLARAEDFGSGRNQLTPADLTNRKTHEANHNARPAEEILSEFRAARQALIEYIQQSSAVGKGKTIPHPRLGTPMRFTDHLYFVAEHDDHHLAAIWELTAPGKVRPPGFADSRTAQERR
jgi:uncharacterized damage-inducible protein DinB